MFRAGMFMQLTDSGRLNQTPYYLSIKRGVGGGGPTNNSESSFIIRGYFDLCCHF